MNDLFRKEAVDSFKKQFSTERRLSRISISTLIMTALFIISLKLISVWFFNGVVVNSIDIKGVVYPSAGMRKIFASQNGILSNINVQSGDRVEEGEVIAVIPDDFNLNDLDFNIKYGKADDIETMNDLTDKFIEDERKQYEENSFVRSVANGTVVTIAQKGDYVEKGKIIALIAAEDKIFDRDRVIIFLPTKMKNRVREGDIAQISPSYAKREKYGYINGHVHTIGSEVVSKREIMENYNFYNIPNMIDDNETYVTVMIALDENSKYESGLAWSQSLSGSISPELGTYCDCSIITEEKSPFKMLFGR